MYIYTTSLLSLSPFPYCFALRLIQRHTHTHPPTHRHTHTHTTHTQVARLDRVMYDVLDAMMDVSDLRALPHKVLSSICTHLHA